MKKYLLILLIICIFLISSCDYKPSKASVISLSKVDFQSNDPQIQGEAWLLTMVQNGASQYATGYFTSGEIEDDGKQAQNNLDIIIENTPQECQYDILQQNQFLYNINVFQISSSLTKYGIEDKCNEECFSTGGTYCGSPDFITPYKIYCFKKTKSATYGTVSFDKLKFESNIITNIDNTQYSGSISNENTQSVWLAYGIVQASWIGNLVSGEDCPRSTEQDIVALRYNNVWKYIDKTRWNDYRSYDISGFENCLFSIQSGELAGDYQTCVNNYNNKANNALITKNFVATGGEVATSKIISGGNGEGNIVLGKDIQFPMFTMRVKADVLGVYIPVGKPKITDIGTDCFGTGDEGEIYVNIHNLGDIQASFVVSATCDSPFRQSGTSITAQISGMQSKIIYIPITGETAQTEERKTCIVTVYDKENPNQRDEKSIQVCVKGINICSPNEERCLGEKLQKCNTAGTAWVTIDESATSCKSSECSTDADCPQREGYSVSCKKENIFSSIKRCVYTKGECSPIWSIAGVTIIPDLPCYLKEYKIYVAIGLGLIAFLFLLLLLKDKMNWKKDKVIITIISLIFGAIIGIMLYALFDIVFWFVIIALIIILIIKLISKK